MRAGEASRTAQYMALFRALESTRGAARLFDDPYASAFLPGGLRAVAQAARVPAVGELVRRYIDRRWPGVRTSAVARTRHIDDVVTDALRAGATQAVILGVAQAIDAGSLRVLVGGVFPLADVQTASAHRPPHGKAVLPS